jgi:hypothetical protein
MATLVFAASSKLAAARPEPVTARPETDSAPSDPEAASDVASTPVAPPILEVRPAARPLVVPLTPTRFRIQFTASEETNVLLRRAQNLLRHQIPDGDVGEVMAKALKVLVRELETEKLAVTDRPRGSRGTAPSSCRIPAAVRREVWMRDDGQCAFVAPNGRRCAERAFLEFHHVEPYAAGGRATVENIALRCRAHNGYEAQLFFGQSRSPGVREARPMRGADGYFVRPVTFRHSQRIGS